MPSDEIQALERAIAEITEIAKGFGLDFYPMRYEICPADIIYTFGAYGMPTRFGHWSFGKTFHKMKSQYDFGLSKIYELVINSNPCYAFLLDGNSLVQNKLIVAHVLAHCDFFKNNARFSQTNRDMVESMSATADRIAEYSVSYGTETVENFIDAVLSIQEHIDPSLIQQARPVKSYYERERQNEQSGKKRNEQKPGPYDDLWRISQQDSTAKPEQAPLQGSFKAFPPEPEKDVVWFIQQYSNCLADWQRDIMTMLRDEMLYFWPQMETKIMNEGWASYWHQRIMRELDLTSEETIEFAKLNSAVVQPSRQSLNPYYLGLKILEDIERRWDREKLFEVRELDSDISFIRSYMTKELVEDLDLYVFEKKGPEWKITDKAWENVRDQLVQARINGGSPYLVVQDGDYERNGELYIAHHYEGIELDLKYLERTLPHICTLWGRTVHLETVVEDKKALFSYDGKKVLRKFL
ncbi:SpoVR family protein [Paenibacillus sp. HN-1]|uniref:SpoVR family protein n=1 Tax=Paenibacillus TaxID=44249 RepID=UPI001CA8EB66|nr:MULTISPECIES: SpoVR family protein [Paenibacillus]MBY9080441.1 SpoVR family protein [Paenibacillus sp. CGMCC 1.18879]MBY9084021.1 SpoVR family protein [Paenibacillus sinensis]